MKEPKKRELKPKLRFPEFRHEAGWEKKHLGEIAKVVASGDLNVEYFSPSSSTRHTYPVYSNAIEQEGLYGYYSLAKYPRNSITITARGNLGVAFIRNQNFMSIGRLIVVSNFRETNPYFIKECWNYSAVVPQEVTSIPQLTAVAAKATVLAIPFLPEQQKIADCLSSIDDLITLQTQKLDALKTHKKGLMQRLFPAEGKSLPQLRFSEFLDGIEWNNKYIYEIGEIITGSTPSTLCFKNYGGEWPFVSPGDISEQRYIEKTKTTLSDLGFKETRVVRPNSILFVCIGSTIGKIAQNRNKCATNQQINSLMPATGYSNSFIYFCLQKDANKIAQLAGKHAVPIINKTIFSSFVVKLPLFPEQQKIADCLTAIEDLITLQTQKLNTLKTHKKALMQQLFPTLDEVSG